MSNAPGQTHSSARGGVSHAQRQGGTAQRGSVLFCITLSRLFISVPHRVI